MFSISLKPKAAPAQQAPPLKKSVAFGAADDDTLDAAPTASSSGRADVNKRLAAMGSGSVSKVQRRKIEEEMKVDQSVYQYDEIWDNMQAAKQMAKESKEAASKDRQPKYIKNLLETAETRRLDHLRAEEKKIKMEREMEGDEFEGKEQFVTQAYKDQQAAVRAAEEEEKQREGAVIYLLSSLTYLRSLCLAAQKAKSMSSGMTHFYAQLLKQTEDQHTATIAAAQQLEKTTKGPTLQNLTISKPPELMRKSDKQLADEAIMEGKEVELNDDNQIVDRRELLSAGLNLAAPNTRSIGGLQRGQKRKVPPEEVQVHRAVGTAASRREIEQRRAREVQMQLEEEQEKVRKLAAEREEEERKRTIEKRNNEEQIQSARERYLERKRRKAEETAAALNTA
jgi:coiled-coil domain-containing protein 55